MIGSTSLVKTSRVENALLKARNVLGSVLLLLLSSCATQSFTVPEHLTALPTATELDEGSLIEEAEVPTSLANRKMPALEVASWSGDSDSKWQMLGLSEQKTDLNVESMPLNRFIQVSLGDVLGLTFIVDPDVQVREELVTLRVSKPITEKEMLDTVEQILTGYDVGLSIDDGTLEVLPAAKLVSLAPSFVSSRTKLAMRQGKIMTIIPIRYSNPGEAVRFARHFIDLGANAEIATMQRLNALMVIGDAAQVARFQSIIEMVDQPSMAGRKIEMFRPTYWQAGELMSLLREAMVLQGIEVAGSAAAPGVYLFEVKRLNSMMVAAPDDSVMSWINDWILALDTTEAAGDMLRSFVYPVKHSTAKELGSVVQELLASFNEGQLSSNGEVVTNAPDLKMVVDEPHNSLVFVGSAQSYKAVIQLLEQVDTPAKQVLLEVTVADITLEANMQLGVEWRFNDSHGDYDGVGGTLNGLGVGSAGFNYTAFDSAGDIRARINALATNGDAQILSSPRLLAVDNEEARIQVGTQIAIVSSENTSDSVDGIIRSFTYVDTGVILSFTPTVMAAGQVRLRVNQEVSVPGPSLNNTPPINTRSVETTLVAQSGSTIMIGGLISSNETISNEMVPFLGGIPFLGALFRGREVVDNSTEMIVLITPHIIDSSAELETLTESFRQQIQW